MNGIPFSVHLTGKGMSNLSPTTGVVGKSFSSNRYLAILGKSKNEDARVNLMLGILNTLARAMITSLRLNGFALRCIRSMTQ